ncbi:unnamed protein product, partial [Prunus brigantina]
FGVWPESPNFEDHTNLSKWKGSREEGKEFKSSMCNLKLIGARYFNDVLYFGYAKEKMKGVAPHAKVAIYKVIWV